ncbi:MAG: hypothetical protein KDK08_12860, partial [Rhizobiaceae bacterium]|nr:hypothetical protein [Rhizobiaceae bacterium]
IQHVLIGRNFFGGISHDIVPRGSERDTRLAAHWWQVERFTSEITNYDKNEHKTASLLRNEPNSVNSTFSSAFQEA